MATDIICPMYARVDEDQPFRLCRNGPSKMAFATWKTRPLILCEYAHAMG